VVVLSGNGIHVGGVGVFDSVSLGSLLRSDTPSVVDAASKEDRQVYREEGELGAGVDKGKEVIGKRLGKEGEKERENEHEADFVWREEERRDGGGSVEEDLFQPPTYRRERYERFTAIMIVFCRKFVGGERGGG